MEKLNVFQEWLAYILCCYNASGWPTGFLRSFANIPFCANQQIAAFHSTAPDISTLALTICSVLLDQDLQIQHFLVLFSSIRCLHLTVAL